MLLPRLIDKEVAAAGQVRDGWLELVGIGFLGAKYPPPNRRLIERAQSSTALPSILRRLVVESRGHAQSGSAT